jgi:hypothetical protein
MHLILILKTMRICSWVHKCIARTNTSFYHMTINDGRRKNYNHKIKSVRVWWCGDGWGDHFSSAMKPFEIRLTVNSERYKCYNIIFASFDAEARISFLFWKKIENIHTLIKTTSIHGNLCMCPIMRDAFNVQLRSLYFSSFTSIKYLIMCVAYICWILRGKDFHCVFKFA